MESWDVENRSLGKRLWPLANNFIHGFVIADQIIYVSGALFSIAVSHASEESEGKGHFEPVTILLHLADGK